MVAHQHPEPRPRPLVARTWPAPRSSCPGREPAASALLAAALAPAPRALPLRLPRLPALARPADGQRAGGRGPADRARAVRVLRARGPLAADGDRAPRCSPTLNPGLRVTGMLMTMHDPRTRVSGDVIGEVRRHFPELAFRTVIPRNVRLAEAPSFGEPVIRYDPHCAGRRRLLRRREGGGRPWLSPGPRPARPGPRPRRRCSATPSRSLAAPAGGLRGARRRRDPRPTRTSPAPAIDAGRRSRRWPPRSGPAASLQPVVVAPGRRDRAPTS